MQGRGVRPTFNGRHACLVFAFAVLLLSTPSCGPSGLIIGDILRTLTNGVSNVVANAGEKGEAIVLSAAGALDTAIGNATSAFATSLDKGLNDVDETVRNSIDQLQRLEEKIHSDTREVLEQAIAGAQQLVNTLPFANLNPQVTSYSPKFTTLPSEGSVQVVVEGNFFWAMKEELAVTLNVGGETFEPVLSTTQEQGFSLPSSAFSSRPDRLSPLTVEMVAPYEEGIIFKKTRPGTFRLLITMLPPSPVTSLTLVNQKEVSGVATQTLTSPPGASLSGGGWHLDSFDCQRNEMTNEQGAMPGGWQIDTSSVSKGYSWNKHPGNQTVTWNVTESAVIVEATTRPYCILGVSVGSGDITFFVQWTEELKTTTPAEEITDLSLDWGSRIVAPVTLGGWRLDVELFNGQSLQFAAPDRSNPYIQVAEVPGKGQDNIEITAPATDALAL